MTECLGYINMHIYVMDLRLCIGVHMNKKNCDVFQFNTGYKCSEDNIHV